jgi:hypothetical protein
VEKRLKNCHSDQIQQERTIFIATIAIRQDQEIIFQGKNKKILPDLGSIFLFILE